MDVISGFVSLPVLQLAAVGQYEWVGEQGEAGILAVI